MSGDDVTPTERTRRTMLRRMAEGFCPRDRCKGYAAFRDYPVGDERPVLCICVNCGFSWSPDRCNPNLRWT